MQIHKPKLTDLDELMELMQGQCAYHVNLDPDYYLDYTPEGLIDDKKKMASRIDSGSEGLLVAKDESGKLLGFVIFAEKTESYHDTKIEKFGEIEELFVSPEARGLGVGSSLMAAVELHFKKLGYEYTRLKSSAFNTGSHKFYECQGYKTRQVLMFKKI